MNQLARRLDCCVPAILFVGACALGLVACGGGSAGSPGSKAASGAGSVAPGDLSPLTIEGTKWVDADGKQVHLKGTNLGNWLVQEFWMMGLGGQEVHDQCTLEAMLIRRFGYAEKERLIRLFRDNWIRERDWDQLQAFGFNVVRLPILWSVIEDEKRPRTLRADAWQILDQAVAQAKQRGIWVILDLHGAPGGQTPNDHTGCSGHNQYWTNADYQERTRWLWEQIATRYRDEPAVAAYDPLNEPWGSTAENMAVRITELYHTIRAIDDRHIVLLPSHYGDIEVYGNPSRKGMKNVAFELHPYPGLFGDRPGDSHFEIHRDWLRCGENGNGGVCEWNARLVELDAAMLMGEFQPWQSAGLELGGKLARATYDTYASYDWASTSWAYKLVSLAGGQGKGTWGMVTNAPRSALNEGALLLSKASSWECAGWDSSFEQACARSATTITVPGSGKRTYYLVLKTGATSSGKPNVSYDSLGISNTVTGEQLLVNGGFGTKTGWTEHEIQGSVAYDYACADARRRSIGGTGASLCVTRPAGVSGDINGALYQAVTLEGGQSYQISGVFKDGGSTNTWAEVYLVDQAPQAGQDVVESGGPLDFSTASVSEIEALFRSYGEVGYDVHAGLSKWLVTQEHNDVFEVPERPDKLVAEQTAAGVALRWAPVAGQGVTYAVYRAKAPGVERALLAQQLADASYTDSSYKRGEVVYYSVVANNSSGPSYFSGEVRAPVLAARVPARIEAESYAGMRGIRLEDCSDAGGGSNLAHFEPNDYVEYVIEVMSAAVFTIDYRLASQNGSTGFEVWVGDQVLERHAVPATGGWQRWVTRTGPRHTFQAGRHTLRLRSLGTGWNLNWIELKKVR